MYVKHNVSWNVFFVFITSLIKVIFLRFEMKTSQGRRYFPHDNPEELPSGFFKIKSKNLDVLVKKDYYAHR